MNELNIVLIALAGAYVITGVGFMIVHFANRSLVKRSLPNILELEPDFDKYIFGQYLWVLIFWPKFLWHSRP